MDSSLPGREGAGEVIICTLSPTSLHSPASVRPLAEPSSVLEDKGTLETCSEEASPGAQSRVDRSGDANRIWSIRTVLHHASAVLLPLPEMLTNPNPLPFLPCSHDTLILSH